MSDTSYATINQHGPQLASDISVRGYFPTPVAMTTLAHHEILSRDIQPLIEDRCRIHPGRSGSAPGLWHSDDDLVAWGGKGTRVVIDAALGLARRLTCDRQGQPVDINWRLGASVMVRRPGAVVPSWQTPFCHWLALYQLDDGLSGPDEEPAMITIDDPRGPVTMMASPQTGCAMPGAHRPGEAEKVILQRGQIILLPGWLRVGMTAHLGTRAAMTILVNMFA